MRKGGLICLEESLDTLNPKEQKAAGYILEDPKSIVDLSVQKLADLADVSVATIVRLSHSLNYKGFKELKYSIVADLSQSNQMLNSYQEVQQDGSVASLMELISHNNIHSIRETLAVLSEEAVEQAIVQLGKARKIVIFGVGASAVIAQGFHQKLTRINRWCEAGFDFDSQATLAANLIECDRYHLLRHCRGKL